MAIVEESLSQLRALMQQHGLDYYWVPASDRHFNEYVPACWQRRAFLSGFTGSNGDLLVGLEHAWLWTDSRYFLQAELQLDAQSISLQRIGVDVTLWEFLNFQAANKTIGLDSMLVSLQQHEKWKKHSLSSNFQIKLVSDNLVDQVWNEKPPMPSEALCVHGLEFAGVSCSDKLSAIREKMSAKGADYLIESALDGIAWALNLRGQDVATVPVFFSYLLIGVDQATLFVDRNKVGEEVESYLIGEGVTVSSYDDLQNTLELIEGKVWMDPSTTSVWVQQDMLSATEMLEESPVLLLKACKNVVEQQGMREAHRRDAIALVKFFTWLEDNWQGLDEVDLASKLLEFRSQDAYFKGVSFATICGYAAHGAIVHYCADKNSAYPIDNKNLILLDSGGQYLCGTTDVTRVLHLGVPTSEHKHYYTLVLKGHIALARAVFPENTFGEHLDCLARQYLWQECCNYGHGTGHGVGCYLDVHEGPQRIAPGTTQVALKPGMVVSNEPGVYFADQYGIRIENLCLVKPVAESAGSPTGHGEFCNFETLTMLPCESKLIDINMLSEDEVEWVNRYHQKVFALLCDDLGDLQREWLLKMTQPL